MFATSADSAFSHAPHSADSLLVTSSNNQQDVKSMDTDMTSPTVSPRSSCGNLSAAVAKSAGSTDGSESNEPADNRWADLEERFPFLKDDGGLRRRPRKLLTATQSKRLHEVLLRTHFPTTEEREAIAKELNLTPRKVQVFFQNKRQKNRRLTMSAARDLTLLRTTDTSVGASSTATVRYPIKHHASNQAPTSYTRTYDDEPARGISLHETSSSSNRREHGVRHVVLDPLAAAISRPRALSDLGVPVHRRIPARDLVRNVSGDDGRSHRTLIGTSTFSMRPSTGFADSRERTLLLRHSSQRLAQPHPLGLGTLQGHIPKPSLLSPLSAKSYEHTPTPPSFTFPHSDPNWKRWRHAQLSERADGLVSRSRSGTDASNAGWGATSTDSSFGSLSGSFDRLEALPRRLSRTSSHRSISELELSTQQQGLNTPPASGNSPQPAASHASATPPLTQTPLASPNNAQVCLPSINEMISAASRTNVAPLLRLPSISEMRLG